MNGVNSGLVKIENPRPSVYKCCQKKDLNEFFFFSLVLQVVVDALSIF